MGKDWRIRFSGGNGFGVSRSDVKPEEEVGAEGPSGGRNVGV